MLGDVHFSIVVERVSDMWKAAVAYQADKLLNTYTSELFPTESEAFAEAASWVRRKLAQHVAALQVVNFNTESAQ